MGKCTSAETLYEDIEFCQGKKSLPGIKPHVYGISTRDVKSVPRPKRGDNLSSIATITEDIVLDANKKWHKIGLIPEDGQITAESQGTYGSKTFLITATVNIPGTAEEATAYAAEVNNDTMMYLVPQRDGKYRLVGSDAFPAMVAPSQSTGQAATDTNQTTLTITATDEVPAPFYQGVIKTEDGEISGKDGSAVVPEQQ